MDSGNSGSMQSSSGGEEEYDSISRPSDSIPSNFLNLPVGTHFGASDHSNPEPSHHLLSHNYQNHHQSSAAFFDISPNYFQALSQSQQPGSNLNFLLNQDAHVRPRQPRSDPNCTEPIGNSMLASHGTPGPGPSAGVQLRAVDNRESAGPGGGGGGGAGAGAGQSNNNSGRNSKKRTRASRRAPTTVLTTDTSNFRAMVQEFTGIPAPPFSGSPYSRRFDLFGGASMRSSGNMDTLGPLYPLRPSAHKFHPHQSPFLSSSSSSPPPSHLMLNHNNSSMIEAPPTNNLHMQNIPISNHLPFHSLNPNSHLNVMATRPPPPPPQPQGSLSMDDLELFRGPLDGNSPAARINTSSSCKMNYGSSSEFHPEKGLEMNVSGRGEGTVDSWICPSD